MFCVLFNGYFFLFTDYFISNQECWLQSKFHRLLFVSWSCILQSCWLWFGCFVALGHSKICCWEETVLRAVMHWHRLPRVVVWSFSQEVFKNHGDVALRDTVSGRSGMAWGFSEVFSNFLGHCIPSITLDHAVGSNIPTPL